MEYHKVNLNNSCKVKIKPKGMIHLLNKQRHVLGEVGDYVPSVDSQGYYETQLWKLMRDFGDQMNIGFGNDLFDIEIFIKVDNQQEDSDG